MRSKLFDGITLLLIGSGITLALLYLYLLKIDSSIENHTTYHHSITKLKILDKEFNNFLLHQLTFANYDTITANTGEFSQIFDLLRQGDLVEKYGATFERDLRQVNHLYQKKLDNIERFKSSNASAINSLNYLFDLNKAILRDQTIPRSTGELTNELLFMLLQIFTRLHSDDSLIQQPLLLLQAQIGDDSSGDLLYFYRHTKVAQKSLYTLKKLSSSSDSTTLFEILNKFHRDLDRVYNKQLFTQKVITSLFFASSFMILILLVIMYRLSLRSKQELQAFKFAVEHSDNSIVMTTPDRKIVYANEVFERDSGYSREEFMGENPRILKSDKQDQQFYDDMNVVLDSGSKWEGEFINKRKDGSLFYEKASIVPIYLNKKLINYLAIKLDITKYVIQNQQLEQSAAVFDNTEDAITITDKDNNIVSVNKAYEKMTGYTQQEVIGKNPNIIRSGKQGTHFYKMMWDSILNIGVWKGKIYNKTKSGNVIPVWLTIKAIKDTQGEISSHISIHTDLQDIIKTQERADFLAFHDSLTGLPNRIHFEEHLNHALDLAKRNKTNIAVLFIDLDRFKVINDTLGHQVGDEMLKIVGLRIKKVLRETDLLARIGGDEFVVILESFQQESDPAHICKKILDTVKQPIKIENNSLNTTASIGIALYPEDGEDCNTIIKHADSAMYHAKDLGKNNYQYYTAQLSHAVHQRLDIEQALQSALKEKEFFLFYQPQYDLNTHKITGIEALIRWQSKRLGTISPAEFIPITEDNGMIIEIGEFVFESACKAFKELQSYNSDLKTIAINVSSIQFREPDLLERFLAIATRCDVSPHNIEIEITERYIMEYTTSNMTLLEDFRDIGFKISIDDFGTGYSSMSYLKRLPLDTIKIDKSFIDDIPDDNNDVEIAKAIIVLSKSLGYHVIAEGIEKKEQEDFLRAHGCDMGQGYHFSRPLSKGALIEFCTEHII